ncbi:MAG TPA: TetR/AcrR family transcriptional regulator [Gammaproteobacteria bacterium]|nr:TetR/AcrR family transcriptional regulator [Gammaproteobacteria bacterium]
MPKAAHRVPPAPPEDTKGRLLATAIDLFSEKGYNGVSVRDIAAAVGLSAPALYNHFPNKKALYQAAVAAAFEGPAQRLLADLQADTPAPERLRRFLHTAAREIRQIPAFCRLMDRELLDGDDERLGFLGEAVFSPIQQPFMALLDELRPGCDAFLLSEMIFGMLKQHDDMLALCGHLAGAGDTDRSPEQIAELAFTLVQGYLQGGAA